MRTRTSGALRTTSQGLRSEDKSLQPYLDPWYSLPMNSITNLKELLAAQEAMVEEGEFPLFHRDAVAISRKRLNSYHRHGYIAWDTDGFFYVVEAC